MTYTCRCGAQWSGVKYAHCAGCHRTFSTARNFDAHMTMLGCREPGDVGLVEKDGIWMGPKNVRFAEHLKMLQQDTE